MKVYSSAFANVPQNQPLPTRNDMVKNNAGGYGFAITPQQRLERFLLIASEGGTYYVSEQQLTIDNAKSIIELVKSDGLSVVSTVVDFATNNRAPKADAGIFVLALTASFGNEVTKKAAYDAISKVCKTSTHLFTFVANIQNLRGWSRGLRNGVSKFYTSRNADQLAYQVVKYRNRAGFTHRDVLRLAHTSTTDAASANVLKYAAGKAQESETESQLIRDFGAASKAETTKELVEVIKRSKLTWEMVPTEKLNDTQVLEAILPNMPLVALIRNLNRFTYTGLLDTKAVESEVVSRLTNKELVAKSGIHPVTVANSMLTYSQGHGFKGGKSWTPNQNVVDALSETFYAALEAVEPSNLDILIGSDISGSMQHNVGGTAMSAAQTANVLALTILRSEKKADLVSFDTTIHAPTIGRRTSLDEAINKTPRGGGTDCAQPIIHALKNNKKYDAIYILTDNESWAGQKHGIQALEEYRRKVNPNVKVVEIAMVSTPYSTMPSDDKNVLRVVGYDASVIDVINQFLKG
jgi:60 kDa SS-A/Ro ribonucleoprotein